MKMSVFQDGAIELNDADKPELLHLNKLLQQDFPRIKHEHDILLQQLRDYYEECVSEDAVLISPEILKIIDLRADYINTYLNATKELHRAVFKIKLIYIDDDKPDTLTIFTQRVQMRKAFKTAIECFGGMSCETLIQKYNAMAAACDIPTRFTIEYAS